MKPILKYSLAAILFLSFFSLVWGNTKTFHVEREPWIVGNGAMDMPDTGRKDTSTLHYPFHDRWADPYNSHQDETNPLYLGDPSNIKTDVEYNPTDRQYDINEHIGKMFYRTPSYLTFDEYVDNEYRKSTRNYFRQRANEESVTQRKGFAPKLYIGGEAFNRIFGGNTIDIKPQGSAELIFGLNVNRYDNPTLPEKQRKTSSFDFKEKIQMSVVGNIGEKLKLTTNYNTEASFDFENKLKLEYTGQEDEIIKKIEAGNVSLPLTSSLIQGSQSLFGIKAALQFGRLTVTGIFSQQKGKNSTIDVKGGATITPFDIQADQYESNKHFFLAQYFGDHYDGALSNLPFINSQVNITKLEVWVTNVNNTTTENRSVVALLDLGENHFYYNSPSGSPLIYNGPAFNNTLPSDSSNSLYYQLTIANKASFRNKTSVQAFLLNVDPNYFKSSRDFEVVQNAKKLNSNEYTFNRQLGYISLNQSLNPNQVLAVAYEYTIGNKVYHVGELTTDGVDPSQTLALKMLKGQLTTTKLPTWKLMMKNIYALGGYQIDKKDFKLDVLYYTLTDKTGIRTNRLPVPESETNIKDVLMTRLFHLDRLNSNNDPRPDGEYDFIEGVTINAANGRIIFPVREPFGRFLRSQFKDSLLANNFAFDALYDSTKTLAAQQQEKNKFSIKGSYSSKVGSDIPLNAINIPEGSVKVTAGGVQLVENVDYTVDYNLGRVKIINQGILASGTAIQISLESNSLFSIQSKTMEGARFDYIVNKDFTLGGTILHLSERPITQKVNIGDEPISNTILGVDGTYHKNSRLLTKLVDKLPFFSTKETSNITFSGEVADLIPGNNKSIGKSGTAYIDDFEGSQSTIDLKNVGSWYLSSTPSSLFPEANLSNNIKYGFNRAKMSWYIIDPLFYRNQSGGPSLPTDELSNHLVRQIPEKEIFPYKEAPNGQTQAIPVLNISYYPSERGPYNYDAGNDLNVSKGVNTDGSLTDPATRWGGITRRVETTDFDAANVEFIQFWVMDPFNSSSGNTTGGDVYFDIGNISEDILKDGKLSYENGLPRDGDKTKTDTTSWGLISEIEPPLTYNFDNNADSRKNQDLGLDGLHSPHSSTDPLPNDEQAFFQNSYLTPLASKVTAAAYNQATADPSSDDFAYYNVPGASTTGILERYRRYSNPEDNSPEGSTLAGTSQPDVEDVNRDYNQNAFEQFFEYKVHLTPADMVVGKNYIVDVVDPTVGLPNGTTQQIKWYQFKIPIRDLAAENGVDNIGDIEGFNTINFVRMFMTNFGQPITLRFAKLEFLRGEWRKYNLALNPTVCFGCAQNTTFDVTTVNLEENGNRSPINYVIPPGISQEVNVGSTTLQHLNEQSLALKVCDLYDGDARAAYKNLQLDLRSYKKIKMYVHAEASPDAPDALRDGDLTMFIRLGDDFTENYYEYEIPLIVTPHGTTNPDAIWPESNFLDLDLDEFINLKLARNAAKYSVADEYPARINEGGKKSIFIKGNPTLSNVRTIMIGVRNPLRNDINNFKCGEIWVNELRLTDFDKKGGWAATARVQAKLANLGNIAISGTHKSIGFGALEQKVSERRKSDETSFNVASTLYLGKFLPEKSGIDIPMYVNYGTIVSNPQYDPLNEDIPYQTSLATAETKQEKKDIKKRSQDYTRTKSINFTNVKKNKTGTNTKSHIYDIENINLTYAYDEIYHRDINIESDITKTYHGALGYNFNTNPKGISPFAKSKGMKSKYARPIKDFNFNLVPSSLNFRTEIIRTYGEKIYRNNTGIDAQKDTFFNKNFEMRRTYDLRHDITKGLKFDFNANNYSVIDEPDGRIDNGEEKDSVKNNFWSGGRNKQYQQSGNLNYTVPLSKFPLTDWISVNAKYGFNYNWQAGQFVLDSSRNVYGTDSRTGNIIQNSNTKQLNGNFTMTTLYNKVGFLKKINSPKPKKPVVPKPKPQPKKLPTDSTSVKPPQPPAPKKPGEIPDVVRFFGKMILGLKTVGITYSETHGTLLPGYNNYSQLLGQDLDKGSPGFGFAFGSQKDIRERSARSGWITGDTSLNNLYTNTYVQNITGRASIEPIDGVKIELTANKNYTQNNSEYYRYNGSRFEHQSLSETGNYSVSWIAWKTAFVKDNTDDYSSATFEQFSKNRIILSKRLAAQNNNSEGFAPADSFGLVYNDGYGGTQQEVLTLAFLSAYSGKSADNISLDPFVKIPLPNWRITYDGLSKLPLFKKVFNNFSLSHSYRASYNINNFGRNLSYSTTPDGDPDFRDLSNNIVPQKEISQVSISEQFGPLLGVDITWKNNIQTRVEYKKDRNLSLAFTGAQLTEIKGSEWTFGFGYRIPKFRLPFKIGGRKQTIGGNAGSSLNLTADFSSRKNVTIIRKLIEGINEPSGGLNVISIKVSADYAVNDRLNVRLFYEKTINTPVISTSYPTSNTNAGISLRFSLSQ